MADWENSVDHNFIIYLMCPSYSFFICNWKPFIGHIQQWRHSEKTPKKKCF